MKVENAKNQRTITKETLSAGPSKNIVTRSFESASQKKQSTQARIGPTWNVFRENEENELVLHQFLMMSVWELKLVNEKIPEMLKDALLFEPTEGIAKRLRKLCSNPLMWSKKNSMCSGNWLRTLHQNCVIRTRFQNDQNPCYFTIKLFARGTIKTDLGKCFLLM